MSEPRRYPRPALLDQVRPGTTAIEASAGTGKTWTLERLVVDLLLTRGLTLDQILVVTYTEKAASEMLERIRSLLQLLATGGFKEAKPGEPAWALGPRELRLLETALGSFDRAGISTIHAFCQRVLAETAFLSGRPFETELAPGAELFQAEFQTILRQRWAADPHQRDLLAFGMGLFGSEAKLLEFLVEADKASRVGDFELESAGPCAFDPAGAVALPWRSAQDVQAALQESGIASATAVPMARRFAVFLRSCEQAQAAGSPWPVLAALGSSNAMTSPQLQRITERREASGPVGELCRAYLEALALRTSWCAMLVQAFLPELQAGVAARKEREALVDFDDLIGLVRAALADPDGGPALAGRLRTRYRAVLVDEFQDANSDQWDIFRTAFQGGDTFLVLIGDPKQAIYGFRGGDVPTYLEARDSVDGPDRRIPLDRNFRSTPRMIAGYNRLLTGPDGQDTLEARFFSGEIRYERLVQAGAAGLDWQDPSGRSLPPVHLVEFLLDQENRATDRLGAWVTQALAKEIADLLERGTVFLDPENDDPEQRSQPVQPQDIFILVRSTRDGLAAAEALRARGSRSPSTNRKDSADPWKPGRCWTCFARSRNRAMPASAPWPGSPPSSDWNWGTSGAPATCRRITRSGPACWNGTVWPGNGAIRSCTAASWTIRGWSGACLRNLTPPPNARWGSCSSSWSTSWNRVRAATWNSTGWSRKWIPSSSVASSHPARILIPIGWRPTAGPCRS